MSYLVPYNNISRMMDQVFGDFDSTFLHGTRGSGKLGWVPPADIAETESSYEVCLEVPGVKKEDININLKGDVLTVSGEKKQEAETPYKRERRYGSFSRTFLLPRSMASDNISAKFREGLLYLTIQKIPEEQSKKIQIE